MTHAKLNQTRTYTHKRKGGEYRIVKFEEMRTIHGNWFSWVVYQPVGLMHRGFPAEMWEYKRTLRDFLESFEMISELPGVGVKL